uniref:V-type proton ATPase subunit a n=1 Tax=Ganoderma boninense TaxID=34458 RepID=A0A5K1JUJ4_9APHY|nr:V-type proton ATPase subunit a [Ganoderma boninense]
MSASGLSLERAHCPLQKRHSPHFFTLFSPLPLRPSSRWRPHGTALCTAAAHLLLLSVLPLPTNGRRQANSLQHILRSKRVRYALAVGAIVGFILVLGQTFAVLHTWSPLPDDIQPLPHRRPHHRPPDKDLPSPADNVDWSRFAYSQYATNSAYLCNTLMIFEALHRLGSKASRLLMYPSAMVPDPAGDNNGRLLAKARDSYGVQLVPIAVQHRGGGDPTWSDSYTKLLAFNQTQYDRVLALDSDATLLQPMDELFLLPPAPAALPRAYWLGDTGPQVLTTALLLATPSRAEFQRVADAIAAAKGGEFDMEIVNGLYRRDALVLPHRRYALLTGEFRIADPRGHGAYLGNTYEEWDPDAALREAKFLHFSDWPMPKPWINAPQATVLDVQPKCHIRIGGGEEDCRAREMWLGFYADFKRQRADICGGLV